MVGTTRTFIALDPPEMVRSEVAAWAREFGGGVKGLRPVPARNSHITLAFLGEQTPAGIDLVAQVLVECAGPVNGLSLGAPVWLPKRRPRSLALEIHATRAELAEVVKASEKFSIGVNAKQHNQNPTNRFRDDGCSDA